MMDTVANGDDGQPDGNGVEDESYQALTQREETDLERLIEQCEFSIDNAEAFTEKLSREVAAMDALNIQTIMASEVRVANLMEILQVAIDETSKLELRIEHYQNVLKNVRDTVFQVEQKEALVQKQADNGQKLLVELEELIRQIDFPLENEKLLTEGDLSNEEGIQRTVIAASELNRAIQANIHPPALMHLSAVIEQQRHLRQLQSRFASRVANHISNVYGYLINEFGDQIIRLIQSNEIVLPNHSLFYSTLIPYTPLIRWLKNSQKPTYDSITNQYIQVMKRQYGREMQRFFELIKERLAGGRQGSTISSNETNFSEPRRKGLDNRHRSSSVPGVGGEHFDTVSSKSSEVSLSEWEEFDSWIDRMLSAIDPVCLAEQQFCIEFFDISLTTHARRSSAASNHSSPSPSTISQGSGDIEAKRNEILRVMLNDLFSSLRDEFTSFAQYYNKIDGIYSMYLMVRLTQHVLSAQDAGSFLSKIYGQVLIIVKRNFDEFMKQQQKAIEEAKVPKKPKCGIFPFIKKFESLAKQAENIFKSATTRRADIDRWYTQLVHAMFNSIDTLSTQHPKTPTEMIRLENYDFLHGVLRSLKIACLENESKEAKQRYKDALNDYVARYFGRPLEKLNLFFEGVQAKVAQGVREEEIGYQLAFSKQELRKAIKECGLKEVKRGLEEMYRKVEKHVSDSKTSLLNVIWRSMQEEFISQYKAIHTMIERCYPDANVQLEFGIEDVLNVFSEIAQSH